MKTLDSNRSVHISKSHDPKWVRWAVSQAGADTVWFYTEETANHYADAIRGGDTAKAEQIATDYACQ